ncbi:hypothetical protein MESS2_750013 [Mesorhizobium metallidurans STM 2683]|uniref:Uncharacterized protein n=1 Tax=Mesorhizobium metallidurans STM 2683 TaxID=1297569 RepID=M5ETZ5_9HYPH|nr:hypothetical protein MESS2_750013 [Mesorhizobium metallidurans STM 2683]
MDFTSTGTEVTVRALSRADEVHPIPGRGQLWLDWGNGVLRQGSPLEDFRESHHIGMHGLLQRYRGQVPRTRSCGSELPQRSEPVFRPGTSGRRESPHTSLRSATLIFIGARRYHGVLSNEIGASALQDGRGRGPMTRG